MDKAKVVFEKLGEKRKKPDFLKHMLAGGAAGFAGTTATHTLENLQIKDVDKPGQVFKELKKMYRHGAEAKPGFIRKITKTKHPKLTEVLGGLGTKGIYRSLPLKLLKVVPAMAISLPVYTYVTDKLAKN